MREIGEEERGEIAVIFDAGIIIGLCRENREEGKYEDRLYDTVDNLLALHSTFLTLPFLLGSAIFHISLWQLGHCTTDIPMFNPSYIALFLLFKFF